MPASWKSLFETGSSIGDHGARHCERGPHHTSDVLVLRKHGEPFLIIPPGQRAASWALELFSAQTPLARLAKLIWKLTIPLSLAPGGKRDSVSIPSNDPFFVYLKSLVPRAAEPVFAILAGNPRVKGRRFLVLVADEVGKPTIVVKAAVDAEGTELINDEAGFLAAASARSLSEIPRLLSRFSHGHIHAFATPFYQGSSPGPNQTATVATMLSSWLDQTRTLPVTTFRQWQRLAAASAGDDTFVRLAAKLSSQSIHPTVSHGDLAPWNIKVSPQDGSWTVLDWERGELRGLPGFDWFHFVLQPAALVRKEPPVVLARTANLMFESRTFNEYARAASLAGREREWLLAYLFYCRDVLRPAEGSPSMAGLLELLISDTQAV